MALQISKTPKGAAGLATTPFALETPFWPSSRDPMMLYISKESTMNSRRALLGGGASGSTANQVCVSRNRWGLNELA
jgi:hypothetical protein